MIVFLVDSPGSVMTLSGSPVPTFHTMAVLSELADTRMFWAEGCQTTKPTLLWCPASVTTGSDKVLKKFKIN